MSYAMAAALQAAVYEALTSDPEIAALVGADIFDAVPAGVLPPLYVSLGPEEVRQADDKTGRGAVHRFTVTVVSEAPGFAAAKQVAAAICDGLHDRPLQLARGRLVSLGFLRARAGRIEKGAGRKIDLTFRARVEDEEN